MRAPSAKIMMERLAHVTGIPLTRFDKASGKMTKGWGLDVQSPGDGVTRYALERYDGTGTGCSTVFHALGAKNFAEKVWAFEAVWSACGALLASDPYVTPAKALRGGK